MYYKSLEGLEVVREYFKKNVGFFNGYSEMLEGLPGKSNAYICITFEKVTKVSHTSSHLIFATNL